MGPQLSDLVNYIFLPPTYKWEITSIPLTFGDTQCELQAQPGNPWRLHCVLPGSRRDVSRPARRLGIVDVCNLWHDVSIGDWGSYLLHIFPCAFQLCEMRHVFGVFVCGRVRNPLPRSFCPLQLSLPWLRDHQSNKAWLDFSGVSSGFPEISECENSYFNDPWTRFCLKISEKPIKKTHKILDLYILLENLQVAWHVLTDLPQGTTGRRVVDLA